MVGTSLRALLGRGYAIEAGLGAVTSHSFRLFTRALVGSPRRRQHRGDAVNRTRHGDAKGNRRSADTHPANPPMIPVDRGA